MSVPTDINRIEPFDAIGNRVFVDDDESYYESLLTEKLLCR